MKKVKMLFLLMLIFFGAARLSALTVEYVGVDRLAKESSIIVYGKVLSSYSVWEGHSIYTYSTLSVTEMIKGETASKKVVVKQLGGTVGHISQVVDGTPKLQTGNNVVLFLRFWKGAYWIHSIVLGHFNIIEEDGMKYAFNNLNNVGLVDPVTKKLIEDENRIENRFELSTFISSIKNLAKN